MMASTTWSMLTGALGACGAKARPGVVETAFTAAGCDAPGWAVPAGLAACCALAPMASNNTAANIQPQRFIISLNLPSPNLGRQLKCHMHDRGGTDCRAVALRWLELDPVRGIHGGFIQSVS